MAEGLETALDGAVVAAALAEADGIGSTLRAGWNCCACDLNFPRVIFSGGAELVGTSGDPGGGGVI